MLIAQIIDPFRDPFYVDTDKNKLKIELNIYCVDFAKVNDINFLNHYNYCQCSFFFFSMLKFI